MPAAGLLAAGLLFHGEVQAEQGLAEPGWAERPDEEVYVFGLRLDRYVLTDGLIVFYDGEEAFAPLGALAELLEFPINVDPDAGTASGWFLNEDRTFHLDLSGPSVTLSGRSRSVDPALLERHPDDIYVSLKELGRWFPIVLELRFGDLAIAVIPLEPLPLQERIAREERRRHLRRGGDGRRLEQVGPNDSWFEWPFVDTSMELSGHRRLDETDGKGRMTTTVAGIVGGLDGEITAIGDTDQEAPNIRARLSRQSLEGDLLGPLNAREFALGDVTTPDLPLVADNAVGRGFSISSFDLDRLEQTNQVTLRGELPVGWQVEVSRNGELLDFQTGADVGDGRYEFANLATLAGFNEFKLVFYGPQGQKRERVETYFVTPEFVEPGRTDFRIAFNQLNRDLIEVDNSTANQPDDGENRFVLQVEHGINETLSAGAGVASLSIDGERRHYGTANLQGSIFGALGQLDAAVDDSGGLALGGRVQTRLGTWSLNAEQSFFDDFHSEQTDNSSVTGHLRSSTSVGVNGHLPDFGLGRQPLSAAITHEISEDGEWQTSYFGRLSAVVQPFNFALSSNTEVRSDRASESDARLLVSTLLGDFRLRGEVAFDIAPQTEFDQVLLTTDWSIDEDIGARLGLSHRSGDNEVTAASVGLNYQFDNFAVGLNLDGDSEGEYNARLGLSFSFGHDPGAGSLAVRPRPFARRGAVSAQVFLDQDYDGVFDADEPVIADAGFSGPRLPKSARSGEDGTAFIVGLEPYRETEIGLDETSLEDPYWASARQPVEVVTRPGSTTVLMFPVIETGEVDGTVMVGGADMTAGRPGASLRVILSDAAGRVVGEAVTAYDGFFIIGRVPYGRYRLSLDPEQLEELGYVEGHSRFVSLDAEEPFVSGLDLFAPLSPIATAAGRSTRVQTD